MGQKVGSKLGLTIPKPAEVRQFLDDQGIPRTTAELLLRTGVLPKVTGKTNEPDEHAALWDQKLKPHVPNAAERKKIVDQLHRKHIGVWMPLMES